MQQVARDPIEVSFCGRRKKPLKKQDTGYRRCSAKVIVQSELPVITCRIISHRFGGFAHIARDKACQSRLKVFAAKDVLCLCVCVRGWWGWLAGRCCMQA